MKIKILLPLTLGILLTTAGCGPKVVRTPPLKPGHHPAKRLPQRARIPGTQKPYTIGGKTYYPIPSAYGYSEVGRASWYGRKFHGRRTSNGETYNMYAATAAHKTLPMNTELMVENLENGKKTFVRVNDRGPFVKGRILDLSYTGAKELDMLKNGTARVRITAMAQAVTEIRNDKKIEHFVAYEDMNAGEFFVQVGAFTNKANADRLKANLILQGHKTVLQTHKDGQKTFYRVQIRAGRKLDRAREFERELERSFPGAFVIAR